MLSSFCRHNPILRDEDINIVKETKVPGESHRKQTLVGRMSAMRHTRDSERAGLGIAPETLGSACIRKTTSECLGSSERLEGVAWAGLEKQSR